MSELPSEQHPGLAAFFTAWRFLTIVPVSWYRERDQQLFPASVAYFPAVGLVIGLAALLLAFLIQRILPPPALAFVLLLFLAGISGFLHCDGLADSADGLLSYRSREKSLTIMKDSRTGAMGVTVLLLVLLGKFAALLSMPATDLAPAVFLLPLAGRTAIVCTMASLPYARAEGGIGSLFYSAGARRAAGIGVLFLVVAAWLTGGLLIMLTITATALTTVWLFARFCQQRLGGATGDTLGAVCELTELSVALSLSAFS